MPSTRTRTRKWDLSVRAKFSVTLCALLFLAASLGPFILSLQSEGWRAQYPAAKLWTDGAFAVAQGLSMGAVFALTMKFFFRFSLTTAVEVVRKIIQPPAKPASTGEITIRLTEMPPEGLQAMIDSQIADIRAEADAANAERDLHRGEIAKLNAAVSQAAKQVASLEADNKTLKDRVAVDAQTIKAARQQVEMLAGHEGNLRDGLRQLKTDLEKGATSRS